MKRLLLVLVVLSSMGLARTRALPVNSYTTNFATTETPLSEGGLWVLAKRNGVDWTDLRVTGGKVIGTQTGVSGLYDDSVALIRGTWANDQTMVATVHITNQQSGNCYEEVELWGRGTISAHSIKGYETAFRTSNNGGQYIGIVKWLGPVGTIGSDTSTIFTPLGAGNCDSGTGYAGIVDGDVLKVTVTGTSTVTVTAYVNNVQQCQRTDSSSPYQSGYPGHGEWLHNTGGSSCSSALNTDYGLSPFTATAQ